MKVFQLWKWLVLTTVFIFSACTYDHTREFTHTWLGRLYAAEYFDIQRNSMEKIPVDAKIYVRFPVTIVGPKADVPQMEYLCDALQSRFPQTYCALRPESREEAMNNAKSQKAAFLMNAQVIHWNDKQRPNKTEEDETVQDNYFYSNLGVDSIEVGVSIYYVGNNQLFDAIRLKARSPVIMDFADQPVELLKRGYQDLANILAPEKVL